MGCGQAKSKTGQNLQESRYLGSSNIVNQSIAMRSGDLGTSNEIAKIQVPPEINVAQYTQVFMKFSGLMDLLGDTSNLPRRTLQYISKLNEAKDKLDQIIEKGKQKGKEYQDNLIYQMFVRFEHPLRELIAILLNDKPFNQSFPILRENYKEIYHQLKQYKEEHDRILQEKIHNQLQGVDIKFGESHSNIPISLINQEPSQKKTTSISQDKDLNPRSSPEDDLKVRKVQSKNERTNDSLKNK